MSDQLQWGPLRIPQRVHKLEIDMYHGEGKENPSMTTRVAMLEDCVERMEKSAEDTKKTNFATLTQIAKDNKATRRVVLGAALTFLVTVLAAIVCSKLGVKI